MQFWLAQAACSKAQQWQPARQPATCCSTGPMIWAPKVFGTVKVTKNIAYCNALLKRTAQVSVQQP
jgi:hypothetical protein